MFAARNLEVMSWVGHNIFGNLDGQVLDDPANKAAKIKSKDQLVGNILGYDPQTLVSIEYIRSLGDWKTAWDHIHFRGFLGHADDAAIHLARVRFAARGAARARPGAVRRAVAPARRNRRPQPSWAVFSNGRWGSQNTIFPGNFRYFAIGPSGNRQSRHADGGDTRRFAAIDSRSRDSRVAHRSTLSRDRHFCLIRLDEPGPILLRFALDALCVRNLVQCAQRMRTRTITTHSNRSTNTVGQLAVRTFVRVRC